LLPGATLTATSSGGKVIEELDNNKGVWVAGNARTNSSFSATVKLLTEVKDVGGACVYGSNYLPVGEYSSDAPMLSFTGTPMYEIQLAKSGGGSVTVKSGDTFLLPCNYTVTSFTDATGALGLLNGTPFNGSTPQYAASTQTWTVKSQIWSDAIHIPACNKEGFTMSNTVPHCRSYTSGTNTWYYYNWPYVNENKDALCPSPWRVPTKDDFIALDKAFEGTGTNRYGVDQNWIKNNYINAWGGTAESGQVTSSGVANRDHGMYRSSDANEALTNAYYLVFNLSGRVEPQFLYAVSYGFLVRCVK
jgi:uncharacterized protein (TIGR02145 family)